MYVCVSRVPAGSKVAIASPEHGSNAKKGETRRATLAPHSRGIVANICCRERERERESREGERGSARAREKLSICGTGTRDRISRYVFSSSN